MSRYQRGPSRLESASALSSCSKPLSESDTGPKKLEVVRKKALGDLDEIVLQKGKRGEPLCKRICQTCLDCAESCKHGMQCPCLLKDIEQFFMSQYVRMDSEQECIDAFVSKIKSLADELQHIRAKQILAQNMNTKTQAAPFVKKHKVRLEKMAFLEKMHYNRTDVSVLQDQAKVHLRDLNLNNAETEQLCFIYQQLIGEKGFLEELGKADRKDAHADDRVIDHFLNGQRYEFPGAKELLRTFLRLFCLRNSGQ